MSDLKEGDVVRLKSGGDLMTVEWIGHLSPEDPEPFANLVWFDKDNKLQRNRFHAKLLDKQ